MRIAFEYLGKPICFNNDCIQHLVIENKQLFRRVLTELFDGNENNLFVFSKDFKPYAFGDVVFIPDPLNIEYSDRRLSTRINAELVKNANEYHADELTEIVTALINFGNSLCRDTDFDFSFSYEIDAPGLVKFLSLKPNIDDDVDKRERLIEYCRIYRKYLGIKMFVAVNLYVYFSGDELNELFNTLRADNIFLLVIENSQPHVLGDNIHIVDENLCEIKPG